MSKTIDYPDLDAAIDAESWQWLQDAAPGYADAIAAEVRRGHAPGDIRQRFMRLTQRPALALRLEQAARHLQRQRQEAGQ
jgi:hypothetical protein